MRTIKETEESLLRDHLKEVQDGDEVGTMRARQRAKKQAPVMTALLQAADPPRKPQKR